MKESRFNNLVFTLLALLMAFINLFNKEMLHLPPFDYGVFGIVMVFTIVCASRCKRFDVPRGYLRLMAVMIVLMIINALISKYSPDFPYVIIGSLITFLPFIFFIFAYNFHFTDEEIFRYIDWFLALVCFFSLVVVVDTLVFKTGDVDFQAGVLSSGIVRFGDFSSLCNQAIVLSLANLYRTRNRRYAVLFGFFAVVILLTNQMKAILGMMLVFAVYIFYLTRVKRWVKITFFTVLTAAMVLMLSLSAIFMLKLENYVDSASMEESYTKVARPALYYGAFQLAGDFFPLGSGQGTYGSVPVNMVGSRVYSDYGLDMVWGLGDDEEFSFRMDAHWASILGEMGYLGFVVYLLLFFYPARKVKGIVANEEESIRKYYIYIIRMGIVTLFAESIVLALPKSFSFMILYAGLAGLILNRKPNNGRINNCDVQVSDALQDVQHLGQPDKTI